MDNLFRIYTLFLHNKQSEIFILLFAMFGMALLQTLGIASILPFITVLSSPEIIHTNKYLNLFYELLNIDSQNTFLLCLGLVTLFILINSNIFSAFAIRLLIRFTFLQGHFLSQRLFKQYITQPYIFFLNQNSADLAKNIIVEAYRCVFGVLGPTLDILSRLIIVLFIIIFLFIIDPLLAILVILVCGGSYFLVYKISRRFLTNIGKKSAASQNSRNKIVNEAFSGIKHIKLLDVMPNPLMNLQLEKPACNR